MQQHLFSECSRIVAQHPAATAAVEVWARQSKLFMELQVISYCDRETIQQTIGKLVRTQPADTPMCIIASLTCQQIVRQRQPYLCLSLPPPSAHNRLALP